VHFVDVMKSAFEDELTKIAGFARSGRTPFKMSTLAEKAGRFVKKAGTAPKTLFTAGAAGGVAALYGAKKAKQAVNDYQTGRALRKQQEGV
jgi:hypothetical protein